MYLPWRDHPEQIHVTNNTEAQAYGNLAPDHPGVGIMNDVQSVSPPNAFCLNHGRPRRQPTDAKRESPSQGRNDYIISGYFLEHKVLGEKGDHDWPLQGTGKKT